MVVDAMVRSSCPAQEQSKLDSRRGLVCRGRWEKVLGSQAGKVGHDTSGWLVTKGLQPIHLPYSLCVVSASLLAGGLRRRGHSYVLTLRQPQARPGSTTPTRTPTSSTHPGTGLTVFDPSRKLRNHRVVCKCLEVT